MAHWASAACILLIYLICSLSCCEHCTSSHIYLLRDAATIFLFFHHLLLSFKFIQVEPSLCFSSDQISNPSIQYVFFPACLPQAKVIVLHKSTMMHICTSLKALPSGSGFSFGDVKPLEVIFPLMHYGGSFFSSPV